eukprot:14710.XXX_441790_443080_1 [CDS] Oithona nana genome sequencing.
MIKQSPQDVIMVRPAAFGFNEETMASNSFQKASSSDESGKQIQEACLKEFDAVVDLLRGNKITVILFNDTPLPAKPDAVFPNNWFSTHDDGTVFMYPMMANVRRLEARMDIIKFLEEVYRVERFIDLKKFENEGMFLEGTGRSIVFDHLHRKAYACLSSRTNIKLMRQVSQSLDYQLVTFEAFDHTDSPIYHTNVMLWIGTTVAAICADAISDGQARERVVKEMRASGREVILLSLEEVQAYAGNCLELQTRYGELVLAISTTATQGLSAENLAALQRHLRFLEVTVPTIEKHGGGGVINQS